MPQTIRVLLDSALDRPLDYSVPIAFEGRVGVGSRVRVPLKNRVVLGTVMAVLENSEVKNQKPMAALLGERPLLSPSILKLAKWMSAYYLCPEEVALRSVLPQAVRGAKVTHKEKKAVELAVEVSPEEIAKVAARSPKQAAVLAAVVRSGGAVEVTALEEEVGGGAASAVAALVKKKFLREKFVRVGRDPGASETYLPSLPLELNGEQAAALSAVCRAIEDPEKAKPILLHGVTGSGKTEVYLQAAEYALGAGKSALVLVPEISLAPQTVERFKSRFSGRQDEVAILHSHLSEGERHDEWFKIHSGKARVVIGARSAVFSPLTNLGIIIVDEEHEASYKQEEMPKYHARDLAVMRSTAEPCAVLLGSATPSTESYCNAVSGKYELVNLTVRADERNLPVIRILDMRVQRRRSGPESLFSHPLEQAIRERLEKREQSILFLNRRGHSTSLICSVCGHVCKCPDCSVSLTYHREVDRVLCHVCGHGAKAPKKCPECSDPSIRFSGAGTQKVEEFVRRIFPQARVARMDADTMGRKDAYRETLGKFKAGGIDILIGTQMIAKGLHFPNVTLVGIVNADVGLHVPDFRASEKTFQLLTQVAGRAGRGEEDGEVMVQTFTPFAPAIQFARHHDFVGFWEQEREFREQFQYPPFVRMILLTVRSPREDLAEFAAQTIRRRLEEAVPERTILGEVCPAPLTKAKGSFRYQIALRAPKDVPLRACIRKTLDPKRLPMPEDVFLSIDVDPYSLL